MEATSHSTVLGQLPNLLEGEVHTDDTMRRLYATDASAYRELPAAVVIPKNESDIRELIRFAHQHEIGLIPRTAGTSLAGQVVGGGIVVDVSRHFNRILQVDEEAMTVRVEPGVIRDELNHYLAGFNLYFGPETSTANRAMIGGMIGNNSCGANSIVYGSTRDHLVEVTGYLSDGTKATFGPVDAKTYQEKINLGNLEGAVYRHIDQLLGDKNTRKEIIDGFPDPAIERRNTGYPLDQLTYLKPFQRSGQDFNFCKLIAGSEGTLFFITEATLALHPLPPPVNGLVCIHCESVAESLQANLVAVSCAPTASELMDHYVLECTKTNIEQRENRFFVKGDPGAILVVEFKAETLAGVKEQANRLISKLKKEKLGYHYPLITGPDTARVWTLRKAGLGLLSNMPGDAKPVPVIEDTAVNVRDLPQFIEEFNKILDENNLYCVHYAHAGAGELHLRPIINLKTKAGKRQFRHIAEEIARLVKKFRGSLSGEHGDGRLRGEFIPFMIGDKNYQRLVELKQCWDPRNIFNPGKITHTPPMDTSFRFLPGQNTPEFETYLDFSAVKGIVRAAELCNGSGDCRKLALSGGTMCPSYMATRNEKDTTRARANILREILNDGKKANPFDSKEILEVMDLCLSCKGCKSECPSNVDVAKLKAEFLQQYYKDNRVPFRTQVIARYTSGNRLASMVPRLYNAFIRNKSTSTLFKKLVGFNEKRSLPPVSNQTLSTWYHKRFRPASSHPDHKVVLFCDEFTDYLDAPIGMDLVNLLDSLGIGITIPKHRESARTFISKGLLDKARTIAEANVDLLHPLVGEDAPLVGIEPSAILTFRDEYPDLVRKPWKKKAVEIARHTLLVEEYLARLVDAKVMVPEQFCKDYLQIKLHGHCHQKALSSLSYTKKILSVPENYSMQVIPSGCCGMAGSFGYEKEHFDLSMQIGELVLFPTIRSVDDKTIIAASGTSCRHQILDGTGKKSYHPVEILWNAWKKI